MKKSTPLTRCFSVLTLISLAACSSVSTEPTSELMLVPWHGPGLAQPQDGDLSAGVSFEPSTTYAVMVPEGRGLTIGLTEGERWFCWLRGLSSGVSMTVMEGTSRFIPGPEVVLFSVAYLDSRADNPFFGSVVHVDDYPKLSLGSAKLRAVWERRGDAKEDLVLEMNVR